MLWFQTGRYTCIGHYSARWSFEALYSRGCYFYFQGGVIIHTQNHMQHTCPAVLGGKVMVDVPGTKSSAAADKAVLVPEL